MAETVKNVMIEEVYPYLRVSDAKAAIDFYARAFGATELFRLAEPSGRIGHAELKFGAATVMLSDAYPELGMNSPSHGMPGSVIIHMHVSDVDALFARAVEAGATIVRELEDQFYGERSGTLLDPFGHQWLLGGEIESVTTDEMQRRYTALFEQA